MRVLVCTGCGGDALGDLLCARLKDVAVEAVPCLSVCADPVTMATQAEGRATYVFSGLGPGDVEDICSFVAAYRGAKAGWIVDARPLGRLRHCLVTRVPALPVI